MEESGDYYTGFPPISPNNTGFPSPSMDTFNQAMARAHMAAFPSFSYSAPVEYQEEDENDGNEKYQCQLCDRKAISKPTRVQNPSNATYAITNLPGICGLIRNHDLNRHLKTHSQDKPHACKVCGRQFARRDALKRHERMRLEGKKVHCVSGSKRDEEFLDLTQPDYTNYMSESDYLRHQHQQAILAVQQAISQDLINPQ